jgi:hypothetical protein
MLALKEKPVRGCPGIIGVEPDVRELALRRGITVVRGKVEELPDELKTQKYECVVMLHVLEHTLLPQHAPRNATKVLTERGIFIETRNNEDRGLRRVGIRWPWLDVPRHLDFFTTDSVQAIWGQSSERTKSYDKP